MQAIGVPLALAGIVLISGILDADAYGSDPVLGAVLGILTAVCYAGYLLLLRKGRDRSRAAGPIFDSTLACLLVALMLFPHAAYNTWLRWSRPGARVERYTFTQIAGLAPEMVVPHGESFSVSCEVESRKRWWRPDHALARIGSQPEIKSPIAAKRAEFLVPGQITKGALTVRAGDAADLPSEGAGVVEERSELEALEEISGRVTDGGGREAMLRLRRYRR